MNAKHSSIAVSAVLLLVASASWGQIVPVQGGRALDSNYRIGSGRINNATPQRTSFSSQMYITGQVSGLGAFRGETGYFASNQLRLNLPSAGLGGFRRQSVGLDDVLSGQTYRPGVYYDRSNTALGVREITSGMTAPGTNVPISGYVGGVVSRQTMDEAMSDFRPLLGNRIGEAISSHIRAPIRLDASTPRTAGPEELSPRGVVGGTLGAAELAVFTVSRPSQRSEVDVELRELEQLEQDDMSRVDSKVRGPSVVPPVEDDAAALGQAGTPARIARESDVFLSMIHLLQKQHQEGSNSSAAKGKTGDPKDPKDPAMRLKPLGARPDSVALVEQGLRGELVFHTLVGRGSNAFNDAMRIGEKQLAEGNFYNAADQYRLAVEIRSDNPTARLGLAVALFGAGESLGAALQLKRAMEMFPPIMVTRLDAVGKIPSEKFKVRLDQIYKRLEGRKGTNVNPQLAMLATYMHRSAGENYIAELCAVKLKDAAGEDKIHQAFATYVLTGKRPAAMKPTTRPALKK